MKETKEFFNFKNKKDWKKAIDASPDNSWIKTRSVGRGKKHEYVPIEIIQALGDVFYDELNVIEEKYSVIVNEILCTVKIHALPSYPNSEYQTFTGSGSKPIQCDSGSGVHKFPYGKKINALEYNALAARSAAIGTAFSTKGNIFGRNLGRAVSMNYNFRNKKRKNGKK